MTTAEAAQADRLASEILALVGVQMSAPPREPKTEQELADQILALAGFKTPIK
ncbi:hypothetical protein [Malikia granosa]|uniref:hypothetical protein n=1 Tax=Malikia granosa TaxID=263067 RepID=UPI0014766880|nr:hypothetical protein [Malikia granosa]